MNREHLLQMANDIGGFFASEPEPAEAAAGVANHLRRFWAPSMRRQIIDYVRAGGGGLAPHVHAAVLQLAEPGERQA